MFINNFKTFIYTIVKVAGNRTRDKVAEHQVGAHLEPGHEHTADMEKEGTVQVDTLAGRREADTHHQWEDNFVGSEDTMFEEEVQ